MEFFAQLSAQVLELQQRPNQQSNLSNSLTDNETTNAAIEDVNIDDIVTLPENVDITETEQEEQLDLAEKQNKFSRNFTNQQFQIERIMWLINRIYAAEETSQEIPVDAEEFMRRYEAGERDFIGINLAGVNLSEKTLSKINLSNANLSKANLKDANLTGANLIKADFTGAIMPDGTTHE